MGGHLLAIITSSTLPVLVFVSDKQSHKNGYLVASYLLRAVDALSGNLWLWATFLQGNRPHLDFMCGHVKQQQRNFAEWRLGQSRPFANGGPLNGFRG